MNVCFLFLIICEYITYQLKIKKIAIPNYSYILHFAKQILGNFFFLVYICSFFIPAHIDIYSMKWKFKAIFWVIENVKPYSTRKYFVWANYRNNISWSSPFFSEDHFSAICPHFLSTCLLSCKSKISCFLSHSFGENLLPTFQYDT